MRLVLRKFGVPKNQFHRVKGMNLTSHAGADFLSSKRVAPRLGVNSTPHISHLGVFAWLGPNCFPLLSIFFRPNFFAKCPASIGANNSEGVWLFHSYESPTLLARLWRE